MKSFFGITSLFLLLTVANEISAETRVKNGGSYFDIVMDALRKPKDNCQTAKPAKNVHPQDCYDILNLGNKSSGIYKIWPQNRVMKEKSIDVYCDMETDGGGWTVIQRRGDFKRAQDYFDKDWASYKKGFGDLDEDFWLGNDNIFAISNQKEYSLRIDLTDVKDNRKYAVYDDFWIDNEYHKYMLHVKGYRGDAGDSLLYHDGHKFSTKDQRNDYLYSYVGCAVWYKSAWWFNACHLANLNGLYYANGVQASEWLGIIWHSWKGSRESLVKTEMKVKPIRQFQRANIKPTLLRLLNK